MVTAATYTYVNAEGDTVETDPHTWATVYKHQGYTIQRDDLTMRESITDTNVDSSELEAPEVNAQIESDPAPLEAARHGERRRAVTRNDSE